MSSLGLEIEWGRAEYGAVWVAYRFAPALGRLTRYGYLGHRVPHSGLPWVLYEVIPISEALRDLMISPNASSYLSLSGQVGSSRGECWTSCNLSRYP
jgi:hypothetical protein